MNDKQKTINFNPMPLSYHGFAPTAIFLMLVCLVAVQAWKYFKHRHH